MKVGIIGYGSMGKMILAKIIESKIIPESGMYVSNRTYETIQDLHTVYPALHICASNAEAAQNADILFLCVRPLAIKTVMTEISKAINVNCHIVSLNPSVLFSQMEQICGNMQISKVIPSVTAEVNQSVTLVCHNSHVTSGGKYALQTLLESLGTVVEIPENEIAMGSELTSCMPGFIGAIFKVITGAAEKHTTLDRETMVKMVTETVYGTGKLLLQNKMTFEQLINRVATPGGRTEEGTKIIEAKMPAIMHELFEKTMEKRKRTTEAVDKIL